MTTLDEWTAQVCRELAIDPAALDTDAVLDLARDVAHGVARPAAPLTAFLLGVAVGRGESVDVHHAADRVRELIPPTAEEGRS
jgi:hypothetical protein